MSRSKLKHEVNMRNAENVSLLSTCHFTKVGAVLVDPNGNRIISSGYNGSLPGQEHCEDINAEMNRDDHFKWSDENEVHAEINAILNAAKTNQSTQDTYLYTTIAPCKNCAKHIAMAGVKKVFFRNFYWRSPNVLYHNDIIEYERIYG